MTTLTKTAPATTTGEKLPVAVLKNAGDALTIRVIACAKVPVGRYPEVEFLGHDGERRILVRMPEVAAMRQLARLNETMESISGATVTISRDPNPNDPAKSYWGITLVERGTGPRAVAPAQPAQPAPASAPTEYESPEFGELPGEYDDGDVGDEATNRIVAAMNALDKSVHAPMTTAPTAEGTTTKDTPQARTLRLVFALHEKCFTEALKRAATAEKAGVTMTGADVAAMTANMLIAAADHGVLR